MNPGSRQQYVIGDINITPLTDIFLVLLIIMMVLAPALSDTPENVTTPVIASGGTPTADAVKVAITKDKEISLGGVVVSIEELENQLRNKREDGATTISISADQTVENKLLFEVLTIATELEYEKAAIVGMQKNQ